MALVLKGLREYFQANPVSTQHEKFGNFKDLADAIKSKWGGDGLNYVSVYLDTRFPGQSGSVTLG